MEQRQEKILVVRGNFDEKKLKTITGIEEYIIVKGKVIFKTEVTIPCSIVVMGGLEAEKLTVEGNLACESSCVVEDLKVNGNLSVVQKGTNIKHLTVTGKLISITEDFMM